MDITINCNGGQQYDANQNYHRDFNTRVFVNRSLQLGKINYFGFDMDYTLAEYKEPEYQILGFELLKQRLHVLGYPDALLDFQYDVSFPVRGLWFDTQFGNLLKVDAHGNILYCAHGTNFLNSVSISEKYPNKFVQLDDSRIYVLNTLFNLPETYMLARIIDHYSQSSEYITMAQGFMQGDMLMSYKSIFGDVRRAIDFIHINGELKNKTVANLSTYVKRDPMIPTLLRRLQATGRKTFLLTNSDWLYTNEVMKYLMSDVDDWVSLFNFVLVDARKPGFFGEGTVIRHVCRETGRLSLGQELGRLEEHKIYSGGSCETVSKMIGAKGKDVLYFGDHIYGDVLKSKKLRGWRTYLIVPELQRELAVWTNDQHHRQMTRLQELDISLCKTYRNLDSSTVYQPNITDIRKEMQDIINEMNMSYGEFGSLFRSGSRQTFFSSQVSRYADLYASSVVNLVSYPFNYMFRAPTVYLPHELATAVHKDLSDSEEAKLSSDKLLSGSSRHCSKAQSHYDFDDDPEDDNSLSLP